MNGESIFALIVCVLALVWLAIALCRAAADGDRLREPLDERPGVETFDELRAVVTDAWSLPLSETPFAVELRAELLGLQAEDYLKEQAS